MVLSPVGCFGRRHASHSFAGSAGQLPGSHRRPADHHGNLFERYGEQIVEYESAALGGGEAIQHDEEGQACQHRLKSDPLGLRHRWSPQQISRRLVHDYPDDPAMRVSHETIYTSLFVQAKRGLPGQLTVHLRTRRVGRRPQRRVALGPPRIKHMVPIQLRPPEVALRETIGHWEGDLVVGKRGGSHIGTLVERFSATSSCCTFPMVPAARAS